MQQLLSLFKEIEAISGSFRSKVPDFGFDEKKTDKTQQLSGKTKEDSGKYDSELRKIEDSVADIEKKLAELQ